MALSLVTAPAVEPISLVEAKHHLEVTVSDRDWLILDLIRGARHRAEGITGRQLITATFDEQLDDVPCWNVIALPRPPLIAVTYIKYVDTAFAVQTWDPTLYQVDAPQGPFARRGRIRPVPSATWPVARTDFMNTMTVRFTAGYGAAGHLVPADIRQAMLWMIADAFENRGDVAGAVVGQRSLALLTPYKVHGL